MNTEAERQFYLSQMGVHLWYARDPLPGAAPSPDFDFSEPETGRPEGASEVVRSAPTVKRSAEDRAAAQGNVRDLLNSIGSKSTSEKAKPVPEPPKEADQAKPDKTDSSGSVLPVVESEEAAIDDSLAALDRAKLDLGLWVTDRYCLISSLSSDISEELQGQLAANILSALGGDVSDHKRFVWPIFNNPAVIKNGRRDLAHLLKRIAGDILGHRTLLCLGPLAEVAEQSDTLISQLSMNAVRGEHGLAALAGDPRNKKRLWLLLKEQLLGGR